MKAVFKAGAALAVLAMVVPADARSGGEHHAEVADGTTASDEAAKAEALAEAMRAAELWIEGQRQFRKIPAISAAVARGDETVWAQGFGTTDRAKTKPATPDTIYSICSISKLFTAIALMQQWEQGKVALDAPISEYLPWATLADDPRESVPVTLRGALTHSAGLPREADFPYWTGPDFPFPSQDQIRAKIVSQVPLYPASTTWQYSNLGLTLVGETVEAVSGQPFADYVTANILDPLGLDDTRPGIPTGLYGGQMAVGWGALEPDGSRPQVALFDPAGITPAAGFSASVADLAKFAGWTLRLAKSGEAEVLRASTLREMQRVHYVSPDWETSWGLGFAVRQEGGTTIVSHGGSCPGYRSALMIAPKEEMGVAVAMNAMDDPGTVARGIAALVKARGEAKPFDPVEGVSLSDYAGVYGGQPWGADYMIIPWAGGLTWLSPDANEPAKGMWRLKPLGEDRFRVVTDKGDERHEVVFERDWAGNVQAVRQHSNVSPRLRGL
ncbi:serine hydrolase [Erythrobacter sp.]|uniref:serine hydrolase domain-containing protein n=1 Tax=Erythrobacter sp. TaxID=1042 RepID=UPI001AFF7126|nr:serine hydrolase domain-containing protein [Erythrobacter sp.]MBO6527650.1 beta-lactamase family protein [Erythrobacter sp.]MBO6530095.1 beta-lactamase family protein [Erythrobacter sp.]